MLRSNGSGGVIDSNVTRNKIYERSLSLRMSKTNNNYEGGEFLRFSNQIYCEFQEYKACVGPEIYIVGRFRPKV